jgi:hypothetical protein
MSAANCSALSTQESGETGWLKSRVRQKRMMWL